MQQPHEPVEALLGKKPAPIDERDGQRLIEKRRCLGPFGRDAECERAPIAAAALPANLLAIL